MFSNELGSPYSFAISILSYTILELFSIEKCKGEVIETRQKPSISAYSGVISMIFTRNGCMTSLSTFFLQERETAFAGKDLFE